MEYEDVKARLLRHWAHTGGRRTHRVGALPRRRVARVSAVGGEVSGQVEHHRLAQRVSGAAGIRAASIRGDGDLWIAEGLIRYNDGDPMEFVKIVQFRADLVERETIYITERWPPAESRSQFNEGSALEATPGLPVRVRGGT